MPQRFNIGAARQAGYTDAEITDYLSGIGGFNVKGAREHYSDSEIADFLAVSDKIQRSTNPMESATLRKAASALTVPMYAPVGMAKGIYETIKRLPEVMYRPQFDTSEWSNYSGKQAYDPFHAFDLAGMAEAGSAPGSMPKVLPGEVSVGLFGGVRGATGKVKSILTKAQELEAQGVPMEEIRQRTGWSRAPWKEGAEGGKTFYRGTVPGEARRIKEVFDAAKGKTFVAREKKNAQMYGENIEEITALPDAKILYQENNEFWKLIGKKKPPNGAIESVSGGAIPNVNLAIRKAEEAGYDAISFSHDSGIGTVILNESAFTRNSNLGKWRFEIDDSKANWKDAFRRIGEEELTVGDVFEHPELFESYPTLKDVKVMRLPGLDTGGSYNANLNAIMLPEHAGPKKAKETLLHEIQHALQEHEGFARGGSPEAIAFDRIHELSIKRQTLKDYQNGIFNLEAEIAADPKNKQLRDMLARVTQEHSKTQQDIDLLERMATDGISENEYRRLAGEYESRKAAERAGLTAAKRKAQAPYATGELIPPEDLIVRMK